MSHGQDPSDVASTYKTAVEHMRRGRLDEAGRSCRAILARRPEHSGAAHLLGVIHQRRGEHEQAVELLRRAATVKAASATRHVDLGNSLDALGRLDEAIGCFERAMSIDAMCRPAYVNLANAYQKQSRLNEAIDVYRRGIEIDSQQALLHSNLGNALRLAGQMDDAVAACRLAIDLDPSYAGAHVNLAAACQALNRDVEAADHYRHALKLDARHSQAHNNLGTVLQAQGRVDEAQRCYRKALEADPRCIDALGNLGAVLRARGRLKAAAVLFRRGLAMDPKRIELHNAMGNLYKQAGVLDRAVRCYRRALELDSDSAETISNLGTAWLNLGRFQRAAACAREAMRLKPSWAGAASNLLFALNYNPRLTSQQIVTEHRRWGSDHASGVQSGQAHDHDPAPDRVLRVGYVSPDFRRHPVASFILPILRHHDPKRVRCTCYAELEAPDAMSTRIRGLCHDWRRTRGFDDDRVAQMVCDDRIDILVDLAGHTAHNRLLVFARRPAPVQVTWLGYPNTSGMDQIDYRLSDNITDPPGARTPGSEQLVYLDHGICCFDPPQPANPPQGSAGIQGRARPSPLPARRAGHVTFASLNNSTKLNRDVLDLWCHVLRACPDARLMLLRHDLRGSLRHRIMRRLDRGGISPQRVDVWHRLPTTRVGRGRGHLEGYARADIALDPFPWNGHATTCEALWMGVPVVTLAGDRYAGRMAASVLHRIGHGELVATSPDMYVRIASQLAADIDRLDRLRTTLRADMEASPLCDGAVFTAGLEEVYRRMWVRWCLLHTNGSDPSACV